MPKSFEIVQNSFRAMVIVDGQISIFKKKNVLTECKKQKDVA
jgi:hypothetical protein